MVRNNWASSRSRINWQHVYNGKNKCRGWKNMQKNIVQGNVKKRALFGCFQRVVHAFIFEKIYWPSTVSLLARDNQDVPVNNTAVGDQNKCNT